MATRGFIVGAALATVLFGGAAAWFWLKPNAKILGHEVPGAPAAIKTSQPLAVLIAPMPDQKTLPPVDTASDRKAVIRALDKVTMRMQEFEMAMDQSVHFGALDIRVRACQANPPELAPENAAFLQISETRPNNKKVQVFSGWMYGSSPALNALEHPVYDVWVMACKMSFPDKGPDTIDVAAASAIEKRGTGNADEDAVASSDEVKPKRKVRKPKADVAASAETGTAPIDVPTESAPAAPAEGATDN